MNGDIELNATATAWRYGKLLVTVPGVPLPHGCVECGRNNRGRRENCSVTFKPVGHAAIGMFRSKHIDVDIGRCRDCQQREKWRTGGATVLVVFGIGSLVFDRMVFRSGLAFTAPFFIAGGIWLGISTVQTLRGIYHDEFHLVMKSACEEYLATLPQLPAERIPPSLIEADRIL